MSNALVPTDSVPPTTCIECGTVNDSAAFASGPGVVRPREGNISMCFECGHLAIYNEDLSLREPTIDEMLKLAKDPKLQLVMAMRAEVQKSTRKK